MLTTKRAATLTFCLALTCTSALAGRPLTTEDAGVIEKGSCEIEGVHSVDSDKDAPDVKTTSLQLGCGIGAKTQLALFGATSRSEGVSVKEVALVGKTALRELEADQVGLALAYAFGAVKQPGASLKYETTTLNGVVTAPFGDWLIHGNLGHTRTKTDSFRATTWAAAVERTGVIEKKLDLMAEVFGDDRSSPWVAVAARWTAIEDKLFVDASYGVQTAATRPKQVTVGFKFSF